MARSAEVVRTVSPLLGSGTRLAPYCSTSPELCCRQRNAGPGDASPSPLPRYRGCAIELSESRRSSRIPGACRRMATNRIVGQKLRVDQRICATAVPDRATARTSAVLRRTGPSDVSWLVDDSSRGKGAARRDLVVARLLEDSHPVWGLPVAWTGSDHGVGRGKGHRQPVYLSKRFRLMTPHDHPVMSRDIGDRCRGTS